jgi:GNAT superfamily N-acetyltransferase
VELGVPGPESQAGAVRRLLGVPDRGRDAVPLGVHHRGGESASVWIPPGGTEIAEGVEADVEPLLQDLLGPRAGDVLELLARFDAAHPRDEPHFFLSLLGTDPAHAGRGLGMALLAENLERIDRESMPAYLESSNPANNHRYERHGFARIGEFYPPGSDIPVTTMWRDAGSLRPS